MVILFIWLGYLFISLGAAAEEFFCPNLNTIANTLRLSQNVAGVTFLAFGNGAPDIFSVISAVRASRDGEAGLAMGELFGAGMFITTVIVGAISMIKPCELPKRPFLRDSIIYLFSVYCTFVLLWFNFIDIYQSAAFILVYVVYVIIVVAGREVRMWYIRRQKRKKKAGQLDINSPSLHVNDVTNEPTSVHNVIITKVTDDQDSEEVSVNRLTSHTNSYGAVNDSITEPLLKVTRGARRGNDSDREDSFQRSKSPMRMFPGGGLRRTQSGGIDISRTAGVAFLGKDEQEDERKRRAENAMPDESLPVIGRGRKASRRISDYMTDFRRDDLLSSFKEFLWAISPVNEDYKKLNYFWKVFQLIKYPIWLLLTITIPVVDLDAEKQNWKKWLFVLQSFLWPTFSLLATQLRHIWISDTFPLWGVTLIFGFFLAIFVIMSSNYRQQPFYHMLFSFIGFGVSVIWIYSLANEVVNLLQAFGVVLSLTKAILGLTFLAWGNSVGDFVADTTLARQGFPRTGLSACYGGPLLNTLLGIGFAWTIKGITSGVTTFELKFSPLELVSAAFLTFNLVVTLIVLTLTGYKLHWVFGIYLLLYYVVFLIVGILLEVGVINICLPNLTPTDGNC
ncbi:Sodium/potassium/calcium exchanger 6, mitochondrial [Oopsacas minuta]|uniref:Sodium/potassium/calcium exchanger 6, mitochondrial n=1 Tax=Oopsacas minuta TaxID=111878 RepID=A0AAV7KCY7_9METZ|nr:Sodium/potassium/calcium exchanger 6, mitochondrial [Oopsacas minuta]